MTPRKFFRLPKFKALFFPYLFLTAFILLLSFLLTKPYLQANFPYTHDGENHLARFANYKVALRQGQLPPRFAPNLLNNYGYPVFNFNYPLANILSLPFSILDLNPELTFKILMLSSTLWGLATLSALLYLYNQKISVNLIALTMFATNPYLIAISFIRGNIGEYLSLMLLPGVLLAIRKSFSSKFWRWGLPVIGASFLLSHNLTALLSVPFLLGWAGWHAQQARVSVFKLAPQFILSLGFVAWFWIPAIWEQNQTVVRQVDLVRVTAAHLMTLPQLLNSSHQFGYSLPGPVDGLSIAIGWAPLLLAIGWMMTWSNWHQSRNSGLVLCLGILAIGLVIGQLTLIKPVWVALSPVLSIMQFPWRLSLGLVMIWPLLLVLLFDYFPTWYRWAVMMTLALMMLSVLRISQVDSFHHQSQDYEQFTQSTSTQNENRSRNFTFETFSHPGPTALILDGIGKINIQSWTGSSRQYNLHLSGNSEVTVVEPTMNFSGWKTTIETNGAKSQAKYIDNQQVGGRIAYRLAPGDYQVYTRFTQQTPARLIGNSFTLISLAIFGYQLFKARSYGQN